MTRRITAELLRKHDACAHQVALFERLGLDGVVPTPALAAKHAHEFDFIWASLNLLSGSACAEYARVRDAAYAEYDRVRDAAYAEYDRVHDAACAEYDRVRDAAYAEYDRMCAGARAEYARVCAVTFVKFWREDNG
jgi:hypothetical protein